MVVLFRPTHCLLLPTVASHSVRRCAIIETRIHVRAFLTEC